MTPSQLAKTECANWNSGRCLNGEPKDCKVLSRHRCSYFEECVMPMVKYITDPRKKKETSEAILIYRTDNNMVKHRNATRNRSDAPRCHANGKLRQQHEEI